MNEKKYIFVINPHAGVADASAQIRTAVDALPQRDQCEIYETNGNTDATVFVRNYCKEHPEQPVRFIACGGDGTLSEVFNGVIGYDNAEVSCYPCGSGNDFVKSFGGAKRFLNIPDLIAAEAEKIDMLKVGDRYSNNVVNFGFDTVVAMTVNEGRAQKGNAGKSLYTKGIIRALITSMKNRFEVRADGELLNPDGIALLCTLGNGQFVGGSFHCAPRADLHDGLVEVCLVKPISRLKFVSLIGAYVKGTHLDDPRMQNLMVYRKAKTVEVTAPEGFAYSLDGEIIHENHFIVEVVPSMVKFAAP
ncbi:MAG: YegS/Rv2252/BmrU family lipid kinase [Lachnospiraceae bacterium]|nr:YegS/Rv2252/BmrU family lipid kinase [Lachnospiraceae bacterium]